MVIFMKPQHSLKDILFLQAVFFIYSLSWIFTKLASTRLADRDYLPFILLFGISIMILGLYAILWQQVIKKTELSIAYANKAVTLLFSLIWGVLIFKEVITLTKVAGIALVITGIIILIGNCETSSQS